jgi:hypothetical protein
VAGYSGTPLAKKLGIKEGHTVAVLHEPERFDGALGELPAGLLVSYPKGPPKRADVIVAFYTEREPFQAELPALERAIFPNGGLWIGWPKKASKIPTEVTEDTVRELALPRGLVDNKVCAIDEVWSGLRVVWRVEHRDSAPD